MNIFTNGCFDVLHSGHIELLEFCSQLGDRVIVGVNSDESVRKLKGNTRPINRIQDRVKVLKAIRYVDEVMIFEEETPYELIKIVSPDIIVKGGDYDPVRVVGADLAKVVIFPYIQGKSTSSIVDRISKL